MLASTLRDDLPPITLRQEFFRMFRGYTDGMPTSIQFDDRLTMEDWPGKQTGDVGWAYVPICGENFVEAVTVIVTNEEGLLRIRSVEWGRP